MLVDTLQIKMEGVEDVRSIWLDVDETIKGTSRTDRIQSIQG